MDEVLRQADEYFTGTSKIHQTARDLARALRIEGIEFVIAGALAVGAHGVTRMTEDVAVLVTREGLARFKAKRLGRGYVEHRPGGRSVRNSETKVRIDFFLAGDFPGDGKPKPVAFPEPAAASIASDDFPVLSLAKLVELKIAAAMTAKDRYRDLDDVIRLVRAHKLPRDFAMRLDPYVVDRYVELWETAQTSADDE